MKRIVICLVFTLLTIALSLTQVKAADVALLVVYYPDCPHYTYQKPIISEFQSSHPEIKVTQWHMCNILTDRMHLNILTLRERREIKGLACGMMLILHRPGNSESYREKGDRVILP